MLKVASARAEVMTLVSAGYSNVKASASTREAKYLSPLFNGDPGDPA